MKKLGIILLLTLNVTFFNSCLSGDISQDSSWSELAQAWEAPEWFRDAKFGIWLHWGPQSHPQKGGGWYARHMYMDRVGRETWGAKTKEFHTQTYGHPSVFGYKDLCNDWKAEKFDADQMVGQFQDWGAKYVAVIGNHHDNFDLFYSKEQPWNSVNVGPKKDIVGDFTAAARKRGLPVQVSIHAARAHSWMSPSTGSDRSGEFKGVKYDGALNIEDGVGTWWEGMDPHLLYANRLSYFQFRSHFLARLEVLIKEYKPDMIYFDDGLIPMGSAGKRVCAELYRQNIDENGKIQSIISVKIPQKGTMIDLEKGGTPVIRQEPFQLDTTLADDWFYKEDRGEDNLRHDVRSLKELLADTISKNGTLMLNIAVYGDGSIPEKQKVVMDEYAKWLAANDKAIYGTRPWISFGQYGPTGRGHFSERTRESEPWDNSVIRYTASKDGKTVYAFTFGDVAGEELCLEDFNSKANIGVAGVQMLVGGESLEWKITSEGMKVKIPISVEFPQGNVIQITLK
ncbi:MAG: alpha-L-fucosidase [Spirochaetales bacterium]|nr:alpha-L-fucosidase [Spirochaetales bacterium]